MMVMTMMITCCYCTIINYFGTLSIVFMSPPFIDTLICHSSHKIFQIMGPACFFTDSDTASQTRGIEEAAQARFLSAALKKNSLSADVPHPSPLKGAQR